MDKKCDCKISSVLAGKDVELLQQLFRVVGKKIPEGSLMGLIDKDSIDMSNQCEHRYSWGFQYYCSDQNVLRESLDGPKEICPVKKNDKEE